MKFKELSIRGVYLIEPRVFSDMRGYFYESVNVNKLKEYGIAMAVSQENCAFSMKAGTVRGLHFQNNPMAQAKIVRCTQGAVMDYAVDLRKGSPTYGKYVCAELTAENKKQLLIPRGFAHGVISIVDDTTIEYIADQIYSPENDRSIRYDDPDIRIEWPIKEIIVSDKDRNACYLKDSDCNFTY